jgi:hypothetical protein
MVTILINIDGHIDEKKISSWREEGLICDSNKHIKDYL